MNARACPHCRTGWMWRRYCIAGDNICYFSQVSSVIDQTHNTAHTNDLTCSMAGRDGHLPGQIHVPCELPVHVLRRQVRKPWAGPQASVSWKVPVHDGWSDLLPPRRTDPGAPHPGARADPADAGPAAQQALRKPAIQGAHSGIRRHLHFAREAVQYVDRR